MVHIWDIPASSPNRHSPAPAVPCVTISAFANKFEQGDLTSLHWSPDGTLLAVGSYDSIVRIVTATGEIYFKHRHHHVSIRTIFVLTLTFFILKGPIFTVRFSKSGRWLVSASLDNSACLWDVKERRLHRQYKSHTGIYFSCHTGRL